jgi:hypothetical protein
MHFYLEDPRAGGTSAFGPVPFLRIHENSLQIGPENQEVASFQGGQWSTPTGMFPVLHVLSSVMLSFEEGELSKTYGPFDRVMLIGGVLRHGEAPNAILARLDDTSARWQVGADRLSYATLVLEPS